MREGSRFFEERSAVFDALRRIARRLDEIDVPYAVTGGMALFHHGFRRFTEHVDILVSGESLRTIHQSLQGLGYLPPHPHSKHLRDTESGVRIEFLRSGDFPGDGKPKPVMFPDPAGVAIESGGVKYLKLDTLIELKLASGMTDAGRLRDLSDVLELIKTLNLPRDYAAALNPYVREQFDELWRQAVRRYVRLRHSGGLTAKAGSIADIVALLRAAADQLEGMRQDGVVMEPVDGLKDDCVRLVTSDPLVARKYDMVEESEFWEVESEEARVGSSTWC